MKKYYSRKKKIYKKKLYKKKNYSRRNVVSKIPRQIGPPTHMFAKLKYTGYRTVSIAASTLDNQYWSVNGIYDPDISAAGGQPYYYDQYIAMYARYRVYGAHFTWRICMSSATSNMYSPTLVMVPYIGTPSWSTIDAASCARGAIMRQLNNSSAPIVISKYYSVATVAGVPKSVVHNDDQYQALYNTTPVQQCAVELKVQNRDGSVSITYTAEVSITYYVKFFQNVNPGAS